MGVGERIQEELAKRRMSQNKLAKAAQISQSGLSSIINGASSPKENTLQAIANALGITVAELILQEPDYGSSTIDATRIIASSHTPITEEAKILSAGVDKMPPEDRERALNMMKLMFREYADYFERNETDDDDR